MTTGGVLVVGNKVKDIIKKGNTSCLINLSAKIAQSLIQATS